MLSFAGPLSHLFLSTYMSAFSFTSPPHPHSAFIARIHSLDSFFTRPCIAWRQLQPICCAPIDITTDVEGSSSPPICLARASGSSKLAESLITSSSSPTLQQLGRVLFSLELNDKMRREAWCTSKEGLRKPIASKKSVQSSDMDVCTRMQALVAAGAPRVGHTL